MLRNYSNLVFDHYRHPRNFGKIKKPTLEVEESNPLCGDEIKIYLKIKNGRIIDIKYQIRGCALAVAAASILSGFLRDKKISEIQKLKSPVIMRLLNIKTGPARKNCLNLVLNAVKKLKFAK